MFDFIDNRKALESVFIDEKPSIKEIILVEFNFDFQYSIIKFKFDIQDYPRNPPVKWKNFNRVQLTVHLNAVNIIKMEGALRQNCKFKVECVKDGECTHLKIFNNAMNIELNTQAITLNNVSANCSSVSFEDEK